MNFPPTKHSRSLASLLALVISVPLVVTSHATPAFADNGCDAGGKVQPGAVIGLCPTVGDGVDPDISDDPPLDTDWVIDDEEYDQPCTDRAGRTSHLALAHRHSQTAGDDVPICLRAAASAPEATPDIQKQAVQLIPPSIIKVTDYKVAFLTGAPVAYDISQYRRLNKPIADTGFFIHSVPVIQLSFGDGDTYDFDGRTPGIKAKATKTKTYQSVSPDPANPDNHTLKVTMLVTWHNTIDTNKNPNTADEPIVLPDLANPANPVNMPIEQVFSAITGTP